MIEDYIKQLSERLPYLCKVSDLIHAGLFKTRQSAYNARKAGKMPSGTKLPGSGLVWAKESILSWVRRCVDDSKE